MAHAHDRPDHQRVQLVSISEIATLFAGIFMTVIPAIAILRAGAAGALGPIVMP